ncbi:biotin--[acetyl-CoA-carboxylase] ligase [Adhaeribacter aerolatus]|uniref:Biotin--[acetyl-CoA-carboxylase] ligase n=1 Tax=Adhaeribacter aerolatus TaxID=670289 RepID=A0A512AU26_9BACT|nr:biotin--[acetyl-CoA-carboxylase] ligase [Adhaeribacter aerolatus]GEO03077.1 biotin--[acetyl-CoA-carboxylase] ligase [Adhaeribacter aerolatus]
MQKIAPNTLFTGKQVIYLPQCDSTNRFAQNLINKNEATEGTVVITDRQTHGQGQRGNTWEAEPGKNITLSLILKPQFLAAQYQFNLNICISLAVLNFAQAYLPPLLKLKWPNDLYYGNKKIGGILIQNSLYGQLIQHAVVGIGLNINQHLFTAPAASSFAQITGKTFDLRSLIERLLEFIEARYLQLKAGKAALLRFEYLQNLYRYQEEHTYQVGGQLVSGTIIGVDDAGRLCLHVGQEVQYFNLKEISFIQNSD